MAAAVKARTAPAATAKRPTATTRSPATRDSPQLTRKMRRQSGKRYRRK